MNLIQELFDYAMNTFWFFVECCYGLLGASPYSWRGIWDVIQSYNVDYYIVEACMAALTVIWLIGLCRSITSIERPDGYMTIFWQMMRLFIPAALIVSYGFVCRVLVNTITSMTAGTAGIDYLSSAGDNPLASTGSEIMEQFLEANEGSTDFWGDVICQTIALFITFAFFLYSAFVGIKILLTCYLRMFKLYVLFMIAPIAFTCYGSQQTQHVATKYLETLAKTCLQGLVIVLVFMVYKIYISSDALITFDIGDPDKAMSAMCGYLLGVFLNMTILYGMIEGSDQLIERWM